MTEFSTFWFISRPETNKLLNTRTKIKHVHYKLYFIDIERFSKLQ